MQEDCHNTLSEKDQGTVVYQEEDKKINSYLFVQKQYILEDTQKANKNAYLEG